MGIEDFLAHEFKDMTDRIRSGFENNMRQREKNPFLPFKNTAIKKYMALGRSFDSQLGNRIQRIVFFLAREKYGTIGVPNITVLSLDDISNSITVTLYTIPLDLDRKWQNKSFNPFVQYVYVSRDLDEATIKRKLKIKKSCTELLTMTYTISSNPTTNKALATWKGRSYPVDLLTVSLRDNPVRSIDALRVYEIKLGGNLDTKNAPSNAEEVLKNKNVFSFINNSHSYFATCYGECSQAVRRAIAEKECELLSPEEFWPSVLPEGLSYAQLIDLFQTQFTSSHIEEAIEAL